MKAIQMVDLQRQYTKIQPEIEQAIKGVLESASYINGPEVKSFTQELNTYMGAAHTIPCANGTDALQVAMMALGLKPGDEVISPDFTFIATVEAIALLGLTPVLVDVGPGTFNISPAAIEQAITPRTKAIVPVHLYGQCADMEALMQIAEKHKLYVIEDAAQALGAEYTFSDGRVRKAGTIGHIGCTSFFPSKNLGCYGDGGALFTNDGQIAGRIQMMVNHGSERKYYHDEIGVNSRLDSIQAAILRVKLPLLDSYNQARQAAAAYYDRAFAEIDSLQTPAKSSKSSHIYHQYTVKVQDGKRGELKEHLNSAGVPAMIYYPVPMHQQKAYNRPSFLQGDYKTSTALSEQVLSLPMHTELDEDQLAFITETVETFFK